MADGIRLGLALAHIADDGRGHDLIDHLTSVSTLAASFAMRVGSSRHAARRSPAACCDLNGRRHSGHAARRRNKICCSCRRTMGSVQRTELREAPLALWKSVTEIDNVVVERSANLNHRVVVGCHEGGRLMSRHEYATVGDMVFGSPSFRLWTRGFQTIGAARFPGIDPDTRDAKLL